MPVQFHRFTDEEQLLVDRIVERWCSLTGADPMDVYMDLSATHAHIPLDLQKLAEAPDFSFGHDMAGIARHLNRKTGLIENCFLPRCAFPEDCDA